MRARPLGIVWFTLGMLSATLAVAADRDLRLIEASRNDDAAAVKAALAAGVDVNAPSGDGSTALHWAAQNDDLALADLLIGKGANTDATTDLGVTPLWVAATNSSTAMINRLLDARADPNLAPPTNGTPLMVAARRGNSEAAKALLAHGADPNAREASHGQTALMWAVSERHPDVVRLLLDAHADVAARSRSWTQRVLLCCQYYEGDEDGAVIVEKGGFTPLLFAAQDGDVESARLLLAAGAQFGDATPGRASALVIAAHAGQTEVARLLLDAGADPNDMGAGYSALHVAATAGDLALAQALIARGADLNAHQQKGSPTKRMPSGHALDIKMTGATPYFLAVRAGQIDLMRLLASKGADTAIPLKDGRTALMVIAGAGTVEGPVVSDARAAEVIRLAIQLGTPVNQAGPTGDTALHVAATKRRDLIVQALADSGAALDARNRDGETPLAAALKPPPVKGTGMLVDYEFLLHHTATAELLRKLGAKS
ncbi:MAG TPA: ankyrin repeat domain-containing protein [Phenylobacterium sp.]|nr:ankyrin repeat domain-containing protein [Phenylobacterium sp.]